MNPTIVAFAAGAGETVASGMTEPLTTGVTDAVGLVSTAFDAITSGMTEPLTTGVTDAVGLVSTAFDAITKNGVLVTLLGVMLLKAGLSGFRSLKNSVK